MVAIKISEINLIKDYAELTNNSSVKINLKNWKLIDTTPTNQKRHEFIFQKDFFLQQDASVKIWSCIGHDDLANIYQNRRALIWNNPGDTATLYDADSDKVSEVTVGIPPKSGGRGTPPIPPTPTKITISGYVKDAVCGQAIASASLTFQPFKGLGETKTNSDESGHYEAELNGGQDYTVTISATNYDDLPDTINTKAGKDMTKNFKLNPNLEIELGVDSTEVKFTRKDDNKINITQELKNKIIVDFNSDYTFTINLSIKKGMTDKIKGILIENSTTNKDLRESNVCRISDADKTITFTFNSIKQKWDWVALGAFWYVDSEKTKAQLEKTFKYALELSGSYGKNKFSPNKPFELGKIVVRINEEKLFYLVQYDLLIYSLWKAIEAAAAFTVATVVFPPAALAAAAAGAAVVILAEQKTAALASAKDPPQFDKNYKKFVKPKLNLKTRDVQKRARQVVYILDSVITSRDRLYSAYTMRDEKLVKRHVHNTNKLLNTYNVNAKFLSKHIKSAVKTLKKYKKHIDIKAVAQFRKSVRRKILPHSLITNTIKAIGISNKDAHVVIRALTSKKFTDKDLSLASHLDKLPKLVDGFNKLLVKNIKKEVKCYDKIKRRI